MAQMQPDEALEVLRAVWSGQGQGVADVDEACGINTPCKAAGQMGFEGLADETGDVAAAWKATLAREGKLGKEGESIRDVVFGSQSPAGTEPARTVGR